MINSYSFQMCARSDNWEAWKNVYEWNCKLISLYSRGSVLYIRVSVQERNFEFGESELVYSCQEQMYDTKHTCMTPLFWEEVVNKSVVWLAHVLEQVFIYVFRIVFQVIRKKSKGLDNYRLKRSVAWNTVLFLGFVFTCFLKLFSSFVVHFSTMHLGL